MSIDAFPPTGTDTDDTLQAIADLSTSANTMPYFTGVDTAALTPLTPFIRTLLDDPDLATAQATLGITGGGGYTDEQAQDAVGAMLVDTATIDLTYTDATPALSASVIAGSIGTPQLANDAVTYAKLQNVTDGRLLGRSAGSAGDAQEITVGAGLSLSAGALTATGTSYTDEQAQDAVGAMLINTSTVTLTYGDGGPTLQADVNNTSITEAKLAFVDVTTRDASTTAHGLLRKLSGTATQYLDGSGGWTTPAGGGDSYWSRVDLGTNTLESTMLAFWNLDEATGNRVDSVSGLALVPTGTAGQVSNGPGKIGQALAMNGTNGTFLSMADTPTVSAGPNMSFTLACWVYVIDTGANMGFVGKGSAAVSSNNVEYLLWQYNGTWHFQVGNGSAFVLCTSSFAPVANQWCLLIGWYDHVADLQYIQVNDGTPVQVANTGGSYDSALPFEVGRTVGFPSQSLNGRIDLVAFDKRVWTPAERAAYWNNGNGLAYPFAIPSRLSPATIGDQLALTATPLTQERLEVDGAVKLGDAVGTTDGTLRWSGTDFEGRKGGAWVSMTTPALPSPFLLMGA